MINPAAEKLMGLNASDLLGHTALEKFPDFATDGLFEKFTRIIEENVALEFEHQSLASGPLRWYRLAGVKLGDGLALSYTEITARKLSEQQLREAKLRAELLLEEKEVMLREIHHRVKNNLQVISSLLRLHSDYLRDPADAEIFQDCQMRVQSMALVHDRLYRGGSLARINFGAHLAELATLIARGQRRGEANIVLSTDCEDVEVNLDAAVPLGLIATELISNAYKHAFRGRLDGRVTVSLKILPGQKVALQVVDDGVGLPPELDLAIAKSLGIRLIRSLVRQLRGELIFRSQPLTTVEVVLNGDRLRS